MMSSPPLSHPSHRVLSMASLGNGVAGVLTLGVLFPDASVAFGFLAIVCGVLVLVRRSDRSPAAALVGVTLGIVDRPTHDR